MASKYVIEHIVSFFVKYVKEHLTIYNKEVNICDANILQLCIDKTTV
jgi:hypothetical protein